MAIWHFVVHLVPRKGILDVHGKIPPVLNQYLARASSSDFEEDKKYFNYWHDTSIDDETRSQIVEFLPLMESWSHDAQMFGYEEGTRVELWSDELIIYYDVRNDNLALLKKLAEISSDLGLLFVLKDSGKVIEPEIGQLVSEVKSSIAMRYLRNPKDTIESLDK